MITCHKKHLMQRCAERGYSVSEVMPCVVSQDGDEWTIDESHSAYPREQKPAGLGDYMANALSAIGITKERVEAVVGGPCGCSERQGYINAAAAKWLGMSPGSTAPPEIDPPAP